MHQEAAPRVVRFGSYEVDVRAGELRKSGLRVKLQEQPFQILCMLLERPGELVTREELCKKLWPNGTFVDFEHSLNTSVKKLREALGDEADNPRFIETLPRRGYRFTASVDGARSSAVAAAAGTTLVQENEKRRLSRRRITVAVLTMLLVAFLMGSIVVWRTLGRSTVPKVTGSHRLTSSASVLSPNRFHMRFPQLLTDGSRVYFSEWTEKDRISAAQVSINGGDISHLPLPFEAFLLHLSSDGGTLLIRQIPDELEHVGPLWEVSTTGGSPIRLGDVVAQDGAWSPDGKGLFFAKGKELYVANRDGSGVRKLLDVDGYAYWIRGSPDGRSLRFTLVDENLSTSIWEVSHDGTNLHRLLTNWNEEAQACCGEWSRDGRYFVFTSFQDNQSDVWIMGEKDGMFWHGHKDPVRLTGGPSYPSAILPQDGKKLFATGWAASGGLTKFNLKTRRLEPFLGGLQGFMVHFSRDEKWITYVGPQFPGPSYVWRSRADGSEALQLTRPPMQAMFPRWSPDGKQIAFIGKMPGGPFKLYLIARDGGTPKQLIADEQRDGSGLVAGWAHDHVRSTS